MLFKRKNATQSGSHAVKNDATGEAALLAAHTAELQRLGDPAYFAYRLELEMARARRYSHPLSLLTLTVQPPNEGGTTRVRLDSLAAALRDLCRPSDIVGRADEKSIGVILPETGFDHLHSPRSRLAAKADRLLDTVAPGCGLELGMALLSPVHRTAADMVADALGRRTETLVRGR
jgi:GGDEF domain-containing protein